MAYRVHHHLGCTKSLLCTYEVNHPTVSVNQHRIISTRKKLGCSIQVEECCLAVKTPRSTNAEFFQSKSNRNRN